MVILVQKWKKREGKQVQKLVQEAGSRQAESNESGPNGKKIDVG